MARQNDYIQEVDQFIGGKVYSLRLAKGLSRQQLAKVIEVTHQQLARSGDALRLGREEIRFVALASSSEVDAQRLRESLGQRRYVDRVFVIFIIFGALEVAVQGADAFKEAAHRNFRHLRKILLRQISALPPRGQTILQLRVGIARILV